MKSETRRKKRIFRHRRIRGRIFGTTIRPRLCIFRSAKHIYAQLVNDMEGKTIISARDNEVKDLSRAKSREVNEKRKSGKMAVAQETGKLLAERAIKEKIEEIVFDRGGYKYHGRVKALAEGARAGGLKF